MGVSKQGKHVLHGRITTRAGSGIEPASHPKAWNSTSFRDNKFNCCIFGERLSEIDNPRGNLKTLATMMLSKFAINLDHIIVAKVFKIADVCLP
ncbi:hypothetical protein CDAR_395091 [Caerostris darwini]|uniref:Uncharacterized protein n=1 Tax=Caerostris darwini TaxID=1538125 RepID=A0AAV4QA98_9ARAC|nr:hypothetical protein CDAR_395091 [Caerostris darwini]